MRPFVLAVPILLALAGCLGAGEEPAAPGEPTPMTPPTGATAAAPPTAGAEAPEPAAAGAGPRAVTTILNGSITQVAVAASTGSGNVGLFGATLASENDEGSFPRSPNLTGILLELAWADATFDLDLILYGPDFEQLALPEQNEHGFSTWSGHVWSDSDGNTGQPDAYASVLVTEADALALEGHDWMWQVDSKSANGTTFTVALTLFYDGFPADGYSALAP